MSLSSVAARSVAELRRRSRSEQYKTDPALWAWDKLGIKLWSKQREMGESIVQNRGTMVASGHSTGKALALDTKLPTPSGWTTMGDVQVGDQLLDEAGNPTTVTYKSPVHHKPTYRITFSDGAEIVASGEHLWQTISFTAGKRLRRTPGWSQDWRNHWDVSETVETSDMVGSLTAPNGAKTTANHIIPTNHSLQLPEADLPIDPYVLGVWLGDGTAVNGQLHLGPTKRGVLDRVAQHYELGKHDADQSCVTVTPIGLMTDLRALGVLGDKHVPMSYLRASEAQRRALLAGLLDTDGSMDTRNGQVELCFTNARLAEGAAELIRSLGNKVTVKTADAVYTKNGTRTVTGTRYRMSFRPMVNPFAERQVSFTEPRAKASKITMRTVTGIEEIPTQPTQCVTVDSPRSLYLCGDEMIPTHNTYSEAVFACWWVDVFYDDGVFLATTAPSAAQVTILWDYIRKFWAVAKQRAEDGLIDSPLPGYITGQNQWKDNFGIIIGEGRKPPTDRSDVAFQGRHAPRLLVIGDEAVGIPASLIDAMGNIATGELNRQLLVANPTSLASHMYKMWRRCDEDAEYASQWNRVTISVTDNPLFVDDPFLPREEAEGMSGPEFVKQKLAEYGSEDDPRFLARVLGQWAQDSGDTVFEPVEVARGHNTVVRPDPDGIWEIGCDISRMGGDLSTVYMKQPGYVWETDDLGNPVRNTGKRGVRLRLVSSWSKAPIVNGTPDNPDTTSRIHKIATNDGVKIVKVDASGIGASVIDGLAGENENHYQVVEIFGGAAPDDRRTYVNLRAEQFFSMKLALQRGELDLDPDDVKLAEEMEGLRYERNERDVIKIESKDSMRRRGVKSPDFLDGAQYAFIDVTELFDPVSDSDQVYPFSDEDLLFMVGKPGDPM